MTAPTTADLPQDRVSAEMIWSAVQHFPSGVAVVTAGAGEAVHGSTASAFTFISREPPLVSVALQQDSRLLALIRDSGAFCVNVLSSRQTSLARHFASRTRGLGAAQFDGVGWNPGDGGVPRLADTVCWLQCRAQRHIEAGDHEIVLAEVGSVAEDAGTPLLYFGGDLHPGSIQTEKERP